MLFLGVNLLKLDHLLQYNRLTILLQVYDSV